MIKEAIILAGGLGTRLRSSVGELPKCMAPVNGIPFLHFIVAHLRNEGIEKFIFSLGYKSEIITSYLDTTFEGLDKKYVIETILLGTGGAIKKALEIAAHENVIVVNGDTLFNINIGNLSALHNYNGSSCTIALKEMTNFNRYGSVDMFPDGAIKAFNEKKESEIGFINGGIYAINKNAFVSEQLPEIFSFEKEWLEKKAGAKTVYGGIYKNYFIDIGIPEDYERFQEDYQAIILKITPPEKTESAIPAIFLEDFFKLLY